MWQTGVVFYGVQYGVVIDTRRGDTREKAMTTPAFHRSALPWCLLRVHRRHQHLGCKFSLCELIVKVVVAEFGAKRFVGSGADLMKLACQVSASIRARISEGKRGASRSGVIACPCCSAALRHHACHAVVASLGVSAAAHIWAQSRRVPILL